MPIQVHNLKLNKYKSIIKQIQEKCQSKKAYNQNLKFKRVFHRWNIHWCPFVGFIITPPKIASTFSHSGLISSRYTWILLSLSLNIWANWDFFTLHVLVIRYIKDFSKNVIEVLQLSILVTILASGKKHLIITTTSMIGHTYFYCYTFTVDISILRENHKYSYKIHKLFHGIWSVTPFWTVSSSSINGMQQLFKFLNVNLILEAE